MDRICIDADDFCESNHKLEVLERLHDATGMVFTLFTIAGMCSPGWIEKMKQVAWIDMVPHGWKHYSPRECEHWDYKESIQYLDRIEPLGLTKGFKAPGWQISDGMYVALSERGYWVADQHYNDHRRADGLKVFYCNPDHHFHIGHMGGFNENEIELHMERLMNLQGDFRFIKDIL